MCEQKDLSPLIRQFQHSRQQRTHARFIRNTPVRHGYIQVNANKCPLSLYIPKIVKRAKYHHSAPYSNLPMTPAVSTMRLEKPHSLSYQLNTRTNLPSITAVSRLSMVELAGQ